MCLIVHVASLTSSTQPGDQPISPRGCCTLTLAAQGRVTRPPTALSRVKHSLTLTRVAGAEGEGERLSKGTVWSTQCVLLHDFAPTQTAAAGMNHTVSEFNLSLLHFCVACFRICLSVCLSFFFFLYMLQSQSRNKGISES